MNLMMIKMILAERNNIRMVLLCFVITGAAAFNSVTITHHDAMLQETSDWQPQIARIRFLTIILVSCS
jgi:hypothetical protein